MQFKKIILSVFLSFALFLNIGHAQEAASPYPAGFVAVADVDPDIMQEIRYFKAYNFVGDPIRGYNAPVAIATKATAEALKKVNAELKEKGYCLKIYDAYRPQKAVSHFVQWAQDISDVRMKEYFYPNVDKRNLFAEGYIASRSGHSRGSTVDLTIYDMKNGCDLDMGGTFDYFGILSHPYYQGVTQQQYNNRMYLRNLMAKYGFRGIDTEWWHFTLNNEPYPGTYFDFDITY